MNNIREYIESNMPRFIDEWSSLIAIRSVSCEADKKQEMLHCAEHWKQLLQQAGVDEAEVMPSAGNPMVFARYHAGDRKSVV